MTRFCLVLLTIAVSSSGCRAGVRDDWFACSATEGCPPGQSCDLALGRCTTRIGSDAGDVGDAPSIDVPSMSDVPEADAPPQNAVVFFVHAAPTLTRATLLVDEEMIGIDAQFGETSTTFELGPGAHALDVDISERTEMVDVAPGARYAAVFRDEPAGPIVSLVELSGPGITLFNTIQRDITYVHSDGTSVISPGDADPDVELTNRLSIGPSGGETVAVFDSAEWVAMSAPLVVLTGELERFVFFEDAPRAIVAIPGARRADRSLPLHWVVAPQGSPMDVCTPGESEPLVEVEAGAVAGPFTSLPENVELTTGGCLGDSPDVTLGTGPHNLLTMRGARGVSVAEPGTTPSDDFRYVIFNAGPNTADVDVGGTSISVDPDTQTFVNRPTSASPAVVSVMLMTTTVSFGAAPLTMIVLDTSASPVPYLVVTFVPGSTVGIIRSMF